MARKPGTRTVGEFVLFDVYYEDGTQRSNRRVPASAPSGKPLTPSYMSRADRIWSDLWGLRR